MTLLETVNGALAAGWKSGALPRPALALDALEAAALRTEGAGAAELEGHWRDPLARLLGSLESEADLNPLGLTFAWGQLVKLLRDRIRARRLWATHPEIVERPIASPVIILGHMRSGTTRLHRLLACDDRLNHSRFYEVMNPVPRPRRFRPDPRILSSWLGLKLLGALNPALGSIHPTSPLAAEEEFGLFSFSVYGAQLEAQWRVPAFARFWREADRRSVYREFRMLLQTIAWSRRSDGIRPWLIKAPQFMEDLDLVLESFPDARIVCLRRDPAAVVGSTASLVWNQMRLQTHSPDPEWVGRHWLDKTALRQRISNEVRAAHRQVPQIDVCFEAVNRDWLGEMRRIYDFLGLALTDPVERRMRTYLQTSERSGFRRHAYRLEDFGLDRAMVEAAVASPR